MVLFYYFIILKRKDFGDLFINVRRESQSSSRELIVSSIPCPLCPWLLGQLPHPTANDSALYTCAFLIHLTIYYLPRGFNGLNPIPSTLRYFLITNQTPRSWSSATRNIAPLMTQLLIDPPVSITVKITALSRRFRKENLLNTKISFLLFTCYFFV